MTTLEHTATERSTHARTLGEMFRRSARRTPDVASGWPGADAPALRWKEGGRWVDLSHRELGERASASRAG